MRPSSEISILLVEDVPQKSKDIIRTLKKMKFETAKIVVSIVDADCFSKAQTLINDNFFDVVILDLKIPVMPGDEPRIENSRSLYDFIKKSAPSKPFYVLGLTSAPKEDIAKVFMENPNFSINRYDSEGKWSELLRNRIEFVVGAKSGLSSHLSNNVGIDVLLITARKGNEFDPVINSIDWLGKHHRPNKKLGGVHNAFGSVKLDAGKEISLGVVCLEEMGLSHSAAVTANLINLFRPKHMAMIGMCCGLRKIVDPKNPPTDGKCKLGDVIVARETYCWDEGKYEKNDPKLLESPFFNNRAEDKKPDADFWRSVSRFLDAQEKQLSEVITKHYETYDLSTIRKELKGDVKFATDANIHWGAIVSGACVIDSADMIETIEKRFTRAFGLEMEAHSIYAAVECADGLRPKTLVVKGVADFGDGTKAKPIQAMASIAAYLTYRAILEEMYSEN